MNGKKRSNPEKWSKKQNNPLRNKRDNKKILLRNWNHCAAAKSAAIPRRERRGA